MASEDLRKMLNEAIAMELQVCIQYMWQHVQWQGVDAFTVQPALKEIAIDEMKHAEAIAERLYYLGDKPTTAPTPIFVGDTLKEMLEQDVKDEEGAIAHYKEIVKRAEAEGDVVTAHMFREILTDEEEHHDTFTSLLER
jgi:bacterioferritin